MANNQELNYLNEHGLRRFWNNIKDKFIIKVDGKGLSTNDFTDAYKDKLDGIEAHANKTVVDSAITPSGTNPVKGSAIYSQLNQKVDKEAGKGLSSNDFTTALKNKYDATSATVDNLHIPTKTSELTNDSDFVSDANYVHTDNNFTNVLKQKLDSVESNAEENVIETVKVNGSPLNIVGKAVDVSVPTDNIQLVNGAGYQNVTEVTALIDAKLTTAYKIKGSCTFANLPEPTQAREGFVYNVTDAFTTDSRFVEGAGKSYPAGTNVVIINTSGTSYMYDVLTGMVDLSNYPTFDDLVDMTQQEIDNIMST